MGYLIGVTLLWAFSFSLIGEYLGGLDSYFAVFIRILFAAAVFAPFTKFLGVPSKLKLALLAIGAIQIGIMYLFLYHAYHFLSVPEILLFTIFTPLYVTLIYDILRKRFNPLYLISAAVAVLGAYIIRYENVSGGFLFGFLLIQIANILFALGQSGYKYIIEKYPDFKKNQMDIFGYFHFGALIATIAAFLLFGDFSKISATPVQWGVLIWLGVAASGVGYFLWNKGATLVDAGVLGIMNNALIPAGLLVNILFWNKIENYYTLTIGCAVLLFSIWLHYKIMKKTQR
ncbi:EamA family transporter [Endomicrobium proavitum]|uniref:EamA domain-containing protein n=1 Tax=Endomicrobium proavitum TaxID=1408281 RepID=A0A0G3WIZ5_9BACT|nr:EamA family transporter [Endomicrobium proavitum]AKL97852.1 conserved membrane protein of unknown function [Endomicrobium proavitum]